jgi:hypothetical protein
LKRADRVEKALEIMQAGGAIIQSGPQKFAVRSQRKPKMNYSVGIRNGAAYCACNDFERTHKPCKHAWAALAPAGVAFITQARWSSDIEELEYIVELYREALSELSDEFLTVCRDEYATAKERLSGIAIRMAA